MNYAGPEHLKCVEGEGAGVSEQPDTVDVKLHYDDESHESRCLCRVTFTSTN